MGVTLKLIAELKQTFGFTKKIIQECNTYRLT